jgi:hypothetical protein
MSLSRVFGQLSALSSDSGLRSSGASHLAVPEKDSVAVDQGKPMDPPTVAKPKSARHAVNEDAEDVTSMLT